MSVVTVEVELIGDREKGTEGNPWKRDLRGDWGETKTKKSNGEELGESKGKESRELRNPKTKSKKKKSPNVRLGGLLWGPGTG